MLNLPSSAWVMSLQWTRDGKPVSLATVDQVLQPIGAIETSPGHLSELPGSFSLILLGTAVWLVHRRAVHNGHK